MKKFLFESHKVLCLGLFNGFNSLQIYPNIYTYPTIYKKLHGVEKYIYRLKEHGIFNKNMEQWYGAWKEKIKDVDTIMISDGIRGRDIIQFIHKENPSARIIVYYLNSNFSHGRNEPSKYKDLPCELVTFDKKNAEEYQIQFKHYYYPRMETRTFAIDATDNNTYKQDIFFIGEDKGRLNELLKWKEIFEKMGRCTCKFLILKTKHKFYFKHRNELISKPIPYDEVIKEIKQSRAILDFAQSRQHGLTYRPMEAMCFQKS